MRPKPGRQQLSASARHGCWPFARRKPAGPPQSVYELLRRQAGANEGFLRVYCTAIAPEINYRVVPLQPTTTVHQILQLLVTRYHLEADPDRYCIVHTKLPSITHTTKPRVLEADECPFLLGLDDGKERLEVQLADEANVLMAKARKVKGGHSSFRKAIARHMTASLRRSPQASSSPNTSTTAGNLVSRPQLDGQYVVDEAGNTHRIGEGLTLVTSHLQEGVHCIVVEPNSTTDQQQQEEGVQRYAAFMRYGGLVALVALGSGQVLVDGVPLQEDKPCMLKDQSQVGIGSKQFQYRTNARMSPQREPAPARREPSQPKEISPARRRLSSILLRSGAANAANASASRRTSSAKAAPAAANTSINSTSGGGGGGGGGGSGFFPFRFALGRRHRPGIVVIRVAMCRRAFAGTHSLAAGSRLWVDQSFAQWPQTPLGEHIGQQGQPRVHGRLVLGFDGAACQPCAV
eukprot:m.228607 g.228607  ORF g.228607 m.228607 type:complete len:462 (+) comp22388_c9_seq1:738-2123(+)